MVEQRWQHELTVSLSARGIEIRLTAAFMTNDFEMAIEEAKYTALPLPRSKSDPTTIFQFDDGT